MSLILLGILNSQAAGAGFAYYLARLGGETLATPFHDVVTDSEQNPVAIGRIADNDAIFMAKFDGAGAVAWQKKLDDSAYNQGFGIGADSSGNTYMGGNADGNRSLLAKYNSTGVLQWQRGIGTFNQTYDLVTTGAGNSYLASYDFNDYGVLAKYNSGGSIQWQRKILNYRDVSVAFSDSNENVYFAGEGSSNKGYLAKYNSSGSLQWQKQIQHSASFGFRALAVDANENVYAAGRYDTQQKMLLIKFNSSGVIQWQRGIYPSGTYFDQPRVDVDSTGNVYIVGRKPGAPGSGLGIAKYNSSGTLQWDRVIYSTEFTSGYQGIHLDENDDMVIATQTNATGPSSTSGGFLAKLPSDGSLTGSYDLDGYTFTYSAAGMTTETPSFSTTTGTQSESAGGYPEVATSMTSTTTTQPEFIVGIG